MGHLVRQAKGVDDEIPRDTYFIGRFRGELVFFDAIFIEENDDSIRCTDCKLLATR